MLRNAFAVQVVFLFGSLIAACGLLAPAKSPEAELFDCRASALEALIGDREAAVSAVREIYAGRSSLTALVAGLQPTRERLARLLRDLEACEPPTAAPYPDAGEGAPDAGAADEVVQ